MRLRGKGVAMIGTILWVVMAQNSVAAEVNAILARAAKPHENDEERMKALGDKAFTIVYPYVRKIITAKNATDQDGKEEIRRNRLRYLRACATPVRTREMTKLFAETRGYFREWIYAWIAETGDAKMSRALYEQHIGDSGYGYTGQESARGLARIGDDAAYRTIAKQLEKPIEERDYSRSKLREFAMLLAASGKPAPLAAVRKAMRRGNTVPKLLDRVKLPSEKTKDAFKSYATTPDGTTWALIHWNALGAPKDLWIVRWSGGKWTDPIFTGFSSHWPMKQTGEPVEEGYEAHQKEMAELIDQKGWVKRINSLRKDSDGDGLTDVVEAWLGLDPNKADSDGDGIPDGIDKNPLAKPRPLTDEERAMQTAANLYCWSDESPNENYFLSYPKGVEPFEMVACNGPVYPDEPPTGFAKRTGKVFGKWRSIKGAKRVSATEIVVDFEESGGYYWNFLNVTVKKIDGEWFCTNAWMRAGIVS